MHDGLAWKHSRETLRKQFARLQLNSLEIFEEFVEDLIATFSKSSGIVDLQPAFFRFTLLTTTALLFGEAVTILSDEDQKAFSHSFDHASEVTAMRLRLADLCWIYSPRTFKKSCKTVKRCADYFVQKALLHEPEHGKEDALKHFPFILELYQDLQDPVRVRDQLVNVLLAGRDTTACTMSWTIFHLVRHPDKLSRLKNEIGEVTQGRTAITRNDIRRMPYLKAVLDETLRLYPQIPINVRFAARTTTLPKGGGPDGESPIVLPKGMSIGFSPYHMHRRKDIFGVDAEDFRPERWLTGELNHVGNHYMPFFMGPRTCLGKDFSLTESSYAIIRLLQAFPDIMLPPGTNVQRTGQELQSLTIVVASGDGCKVVLE